MEKLCAASPQVFYSQQHRRMERKSMRLNPIHRSLVLGLAIATTATACARSPSPDQERKPAMSEATQIGRTVNGHTYTDAPVDVKLGPNTFRIPANYLDSQIAPWPGEGVTLVIEWPGMGPTAPGGRANPRTNDFRKEILISIDYIDRAPIENSLERLTSNEALTPDDSIEREDPRSRLDLRVPKADTLGLTTYVIDENKMAGYVQLYQDRRGKPPVRNPAFEDDWYIARDDTGKLATFIRCEAATYRGDGVRVVDGELADLEDPVAAGCVHHFTDVPNRLSIALHYKRAFLPDWKRMETAVRSVLAEARLGQLAPDKE